MNQTRTEHVAAAGARAGKGKAAWRVGQPLARRVLCPGCSSGWALRRTERLQRENGGGKWLRESGDRGLPRTARGEDDEREQILDGNSWNDSPPEGVV